MVKYFQDKLHIIAQYIEIVVATIIGIMITLSVISMIVHIAMNPFEIQDAEAFHTFLSDALSLIVGIEFLKMIVIPTSNNVIETLMFAVSRQVILDHDITVTIVGVISIALLFLTKKYLFSHFAKVEKTILRGSTTIRMANKICGTDLPTDTAYGTLGEMIVNLLHAEGRNVNVGSSVEIDNVGLRIEKLNEDKQATRVEVIKDLNRPSSK